MSTKETFRVHFENQKGHSLSLPFDAYSWEDAISKFRDWSIANGGMYKFNLIGVAGVTCTAHGNPL